MKEILIYVSKLLAKKFKAAEMQRVRRAISYVKSSLCMFGPCYVRKPYALCPQEMVKLRRKKKGK